ncbi:hypothetical protein, partial [[Clostridium] symbiosum]|uniref:hypothetical protein n=1 Tax=Clostridium symbiosum TaxID=1512 RepID=UPI0006DCF745
RRSVKVTLFSEKHIKIFFKKFLTYHQNAFPSMKLFIFPIVSRTKPQLKARWHTGPDEKTAKTPRGIHHG